MATPEFRSTWTGPQSEVAAKASLLSERCLAAYHVNPNLVLEHANIEAATAQGGYGKRQLYELIQNGADALIGTAGRIQVVLTATALYCANEGSPLGLDGVDALLSSHVSMKRGTEIGRFGLGFKSVLGVTRHPEFYSRSGSFVFDAIDSRRRIRDVVGSAERTPALRLATPADPTRAAAEDPVLAELMAWATTIVKLPGGATTAPWLSADLRENFPAEFLLFSPHVASLELDDRTTGFVRRITLSREGDELELATAGEISRWRVFSRIYRPSREAREDAGELANRETVPIHWAVSLAGQRREGRFWAFFPTEYRTTLSGIVNAPWKTNEDRQNLLPGAFNAELIDEVARMVGDEIGKLHSADDPGRYLELLPARGREARNWADEQITRSVYRELVGRPSVPDQDGVLRRPDEMHVGPDKLSSRVLSLWASTPGRPTDWAHPMAVARDERRSRVERLIVEAGGSVAALSSWLRALVDDRSRLVEASGGAICLAAVLLDELSDGLAEIRRAQIVLTADGRLVVPHPSSVYLPSERGVRPNVVVVDDELARNSAVRAALDRLGLRPVDPAAELETLLTDRMGEWGPAAWSEFWELCRSMEPSQAASVLERRLDERTQLPDGSVYVSHRVGTVVRVRTVDGDWRPLWRTLLPGRIVPEDGSRDRSVAIDRQFHERDLPLLQRLGAADAPGPWGCANGEPWFAAYRSECVRTFLGQVPQGGQQPNPQYLAFSDERSLGPLAPLEDLSAEGKVAFTRHVLSDPGALEWEMKHLTGKTYPVVRCASPTLWFIAGHGWVETSLGLRAAGEAVGPGLGDFRVVMPVASLATHQAELLRLPLSPDRLAAAHWDAALEEVDRIEDDVVLGRFTVAAAEHLLPPERIRCRIGPGFGMERPSLVCVTADRSEFNALIAEAVPALILRSEAECQFLIDEWGLVSSGAKVARRTVFVPSGGASPLEDVFPGLRGFYPAASELTLQPCAELRKELVTDSGKSHEPTEFLIEGGTVYAADTLDQAGILSRLSRDLRFELAERDIEDLLQRRAVGQANLLKAQIRELPGDAERLVALVGVDALRRSLPEPLLKAVEDIHGSIDGVRLGQIALAMYGPAALSEYRSELEDRGLEPPAQWAGSARAVQFVRELGFSGDFAGSESPAREPAVDVDGPRDLPPLHPFQSEIAERVRGLLQQQDERRGLISLPTGAGKTRVAVQSIIEAVRDDGFVGPVLWVADRDELCEQAVQAWIEVWRTLGPSRRLHISRFWSGNETAPVDDAFHVIVATIAKLTASIDEPGYQWLTDVSCVVVDEAHSSISPAYTSVLNLVGLGRSQRRDTAALLGLTATPFRGTSAEETERLVARYGRRRLDLEVLGDVPEVTLQEMGVLARVDHQLLKGVDLELSSSELDELRRLRLLPRAAEQRLGASVARNRTLLDSIRALPPDWPVLLFATSVQHAQTMAALLTLEGIPAAAVSGETPAGVRRAYVEHFRAGRIRVLTNYGVLTQGFDAPSVRAVYIARPTYSPNVYQQMIGRGLRGPRNGGKERCLIVNVQDNILQFGEQLAFHHFDYLWTASSGAEA